MIDEKSRRKPEFVDGHEFALADGHSWHLREPTVDWYPRIADGKATLAMATDFGPEFDELLDSATKQTQWSDLFLVAFQVAATMLRANYELSDDEVGTLLRHRVGDDESRDKFFGIIEVARGNVPKPSPGGSD